MLRKQLASASPSVVTKKFSTTVCRLARLRCRLGNAQASIETRTSPASGKRIAHADASDGILQSISALLNTGAAKPPSKRAGRFVTSDKFSC